MSYVKQKLPIKRILHIVRRLYALEHLQSNALSTEYEVSSRTIYRDFLKISEVIPLKNQNGIWSLNTHDLSSDDSQLNHALLSAFAQNIEIDLACLEKSNMTKEKISFAIEYKYLPKKLGEQIAKTIQDEERCTFIYEKEEGRTFREVDPIKIYTENGRWYLIARDYKDDGIKSFLLNRIKEFKQSFGISHTLTSTMINKADEMKSIWSSSDKQSEVVKLYVKPDIAHYIRDIKLHKSQVIHDEHHDGGLEVHCTITHKLELLPHIKYWLPRIHILEPQWLHDELMRDLEIYSDEDDKFR